MKHLAPLLEMIRAKESRNDYNAIVSSLGIGLVSYFSGGVG